MMPVATADTLSAHTHAKSQSGLAFPAERMRCLHAKPQVATKRMGQIVESACNRLMRAWLW